MENEQLNPQQTPEQEAQVETGITAEPEQEIAGENTQQTITLTQEELNQKIESRLARERKKQPKPEEFEAFLKWKESNQSEQERLSEKLKVAQEQLQEIESYKRENIALKKGIDAKLVSFAIFQANSLVNENTDFETALEQVINDNSEIFSKKPLNISTGLKQTQAPQVVDYFLEGLKLKEE